MRPHVYKPQIEYKYINFEDIDSPASNYFAVLRQASFKEQGYIMANTLQAKKRVRRNAKREGINKARRSRIRTFVKKVELAVEAGNADEAKVALKEAQPELMRGVTKGVLHKKTASRKVSRLAKRVKAMG